MGQHKHNPTAIAAKNGEISPKEKPKYNRADMRNIVEKKIEEVTGLNNIYKYISKEYKL